ncbi:hypothetical protein BDV98DRAFT_558327 [Pterulicium gracile]|uniref:Cytochrome b-c1 complex subunit 10 n=1 Tax=Pterulicium gracile TaxID=1884261 RepID=A0A5C3R1Z3_9AGAR|nr:hypothetical protein BDV98DRAFT_558327 [Pterula gracilis]
MPQLSFTRSLGAARIHNFRRVWSPSLSVWGAGTGIFLTFLLSSTPLVKREVLCKLPVVGEYYTDNTPDSDKAF